ncbi:MAG: FMN adenylyltransferase [Parcubacteria group bacterium CG08_land_8_20_14_0_20_48_21]|nr:MAG: hypothetical protein AUK21_01205 [Parcubacteria group bacterium CG2_30_48_51]PIS32601.1 MAG: FMN adenylyltransferase [Parcubacteria group bacterium CG08_land_8_20_14_0_20_48_21]PIW79381.1 MAG: FMN adenylyltransferase [Parcubacteria group bacterium CG_4_8_14_3_um_filter_48_16]PIY77711.1 MAG: FMN adenylyltransferase [Parcubacteria group bacterium CG_4_10_14_0_8_um_filter_48_154]PIZ77539.1 MAG: FMN adenylyltransferase [bacterium CG_4_10_14_0_2_um_filter_48_144]PJC39744.1 MAG: FMN adenylyl
MSMRVTGIVREGKKKGRTLGFPTLNIYVSGEIASGVYCGNVILQGKSYRAAFFKGKDTEVLEAHLIDFMGDVYGKPVEATLIRKIREVQKFSNDEELKLRIAEDVRIYSPES